MNSILKWSGVVALAILVILGGLYALGKQKSLSFGSTSCASITCLSGGLRLVSDAGGDFESDVAAVFNSTTNFVGTVTGAAATFTGAVTTGTFTQGGGITASSTSASVTLAGTEFTTSNVLDYTVNVGSVTLTFAASTTAPCSVMSSGQVRTVFIRNATTTATSKITIAGGTGNTLKVASTTVIAGNTDGSNMARFDFTKKTSTDCDILMVNYN